MSQRRSRRREKPCVFFLNRHGLSAMGVSGLDEGDRVAQDSCDVHDPRLGATLPRELQELPNDRRATLGLVDDELQVVETSAQVAAQDLRLATVDVADHVGLVIGDGHVDFAYRCQGYVRIDRTHR